RGLGRPGPAPGRGDLHDQRRPVQGRADLAGGLLKHLKLEGAKYTIDGRPTSQAMDLITTPDLENRRSLHTELRAPGASNQVDYDQFDWKLASSDGRQCTFTYEDDKVALEKIVRAAGRPFELEMDLRVRNKSSDRLRHRASVETVAWRTDKEIEGGFGRQVPFVTQVECLNNGKLEEFTSADFEPKDFSDGSRYVNGWRVSQGQVDFAATSNFYFAQALVPIDGPAPAACETQIEDIFDGKRFANRKDDKEHGGAMYRSRLAWPAKELGPNESTSYKAIHFVGPKEREVLASAAGGTHRLSELIRLGTFAPIARGLVWFLVQCHKLVGSWGVAIILLTLSVRTILFPLQWKAIKSGGKMRLLKPELDELNARYADDPQQKQLATLELWKKHDVNPLGGCLPMLVQMPVWFALYTTLQTAAELYHVPFLWLKDLSAPDTFLVGGHEIPFILPWLLGVTSLVQQKIMPSSGMDPAQQKMMTYMMPVIFTAMMLFLPSGLGVYMFTNSLLGIIQQIAVERYYTSQASSGGGGGGGITVREKTTDDSGTKRDALAPLGKDKARV
ncbi:MAG: membrane protein insertase YidC, partial [Myxococcales bacterium]